MSCSKPTRPERSSRISGPSKRIRRTYFEQVPLSSFLAGANVIPGGVMWIQVQSGNAFVYTTITDNRTNDSAISFVKPHPE